MTAVLLLILAGLCLPQSVTRAAGRVPALAAFLKLVGHLVPIASVPVGLYLVARDGAFVVALVGFLGYLAGAIRSARLRKPALTAEVSLLHPILELRDVLDAWRARSAPSAEADIKPAVSEPVVAELTTLSRGG